MTMIQFGDALKFLDEIAEKKAPCVILFTGQKNEDGKNWCPDCQEISPHYPEFEADCKAKNVPLYYVVAGDRPTWKDPENVLRKHKISKIKGIPTMGYFNGHSIIGRLEGKEIADKELRSELFND